VPGIGDLINLLPLALLVGSYTCLIYAQRVNTESPRLARAARIVGALLMFGVILIALVFIDWDAF
jgi:hypothetical protein